LRKIRVLDREIWEQRKDREITLSSLKFHFHTTLHLEAASEANNHGEEAVARRNEADSEVLPH